MKSLVEYQFLASLVSSGITLEITMMFFNVVSSVRSSSVDHGLLHTQQQPLFHIFKILQILK